VYFVASQENGVKNVNDKNIREFLEDREVQDRVRRSMLNARKRATVTISVAAALSGFTESQLREWDKKGYLQTDRTIPSTEGKGHRQYTPQDLDKLMLMRELMDNGYSLGDIFPDIDSLWQQVEGSLGAEEPPGAASTRGYRLDEVKIKNYPIDLRVERAEEDNFWRYFVSQALRLSLLLICEDVPDTIDGAGIILPLDPEMANDLIKDPRDLPHMGLSLVGWLGLNRAFYTFLDPEPHFEFPSDFRIERLHFEEAGKLSCNPLIVVQRKSRPIVLTSALRETVLRFMQLLYHHVSNWKPRFDYGMRDWVYQVTDFNTPAVIKDEVLSGLMDMVVELGGKAADGENRWSYSYLFLPRDASLPMQQRILIARAFSKDSPPQFQEVTVSKAMPGLTFRAYLGGHTFYRSNIPPHDTIMAYREMEDKIRSAIALPVGGADGMAIASMYVASPYTDAFSEADQRALRLITRMIEELLSTYQSRHNVVGKLSDLLARPRIVDPSFREFLSEEDFINELEELLTEIQKRDVISKESEEQVSFIAIDIDNQGTLAARYGDQVARNLSRAVGLRLQGQLRLQSNPDFRKVFHIGADRYYLKLVGMSLNEARKLAVQLHINLVGEYRIDARRVVMGRPMSREDMLVLRDVTVRLGVSNYKYGKLQEVLGRYDTENAIVEARTVILQNLDESLNWGQVEGGNVIITWDPALWGYRRLNSNESLG
jgi:GGDEF domain-containing protein